MTCKGLEETPDLNSHPVHATVLYHYEVECSTQNIPEQAGRGSFSVVLRPLSRCRVQPQASLYNLGVGFGFDSVTGTARTLYLKI
jgi:hypothetical protein